MLNRTFACLTFAAASVAAVSLSAQQNGSQAPPGPAPRGTAATVMTAADLAAALEKSTRANPNMSTAPIQSHDQYRINIVRRGRPAGAIAHGTGTELHYIVEGGGTLVTGGAIVRPAAGAPAGTLARIEGGVTRKVAKGDVVLIPENTPHWYSEVDGAIAYLEVRFSVPTK
jgi:mannose-6-phosphate isomerase-like protein (cupin superfamily)